MFYRKGTSNERILKRVTSDILQWAASAISNQQILQRVIRVLQRVTSNERIFGRSNYWFLQKGNFATSNKGFYND